MKYRPSLLLMFAFLLQVGVSGAQSVAKPAGEQYAAVVRPVYNFGFFGLGSYNGVGLRALHQITRRTAYGIEYSFYENSRDQSFTVAGVVIERQAFNTLVFSVGTLGYFGLDGESSRALGVVSNFGWEPYKNSRISPYVTYRADLIFAEEVRRSAAISLGISINLIALD